MKAPVRGVLSLWRYTPSESVLSSSLSTDHQVPGNTYARDPERAAHGHRRGFRLDTLLWEGERLPPHTFPEWVKSAGYGGLWGGAGPNA